MAETPGAALFRVSTSAYDLYQTHHAPSPHTFASLLLSLSASQLHSFSCTPALTVEAVPSGVFARSRYAISSRLLVQITRALAHWDLRTATIVLHHLTTCLWTTTLLEIAEQAREKGA